MVAPIGSMADAGPTRSSGSRLLLQMGIAVYSVLAALVIIRSLYLAIGISDGLWVSSTVYALTDPMIFVFSLLPGGERQIVGELTVGDLSVLAIMLAVPFVILSRRPRA